MSVYSMVGNKKLFVKMFSQTPQRILVFDTETTTLIKGPRPRALEQYPHIVQITAILYSVADRKIVSVLNEYVALPDGVYMDPHATQINGITDEMCRELGRPIEDVLRHLCELILTSDVLIAHNYEFDSEVLQAELFRCSGRIPDYCIKMFEEEFLRSIKVLPFCTMKNSVDFCRVKTAYGRLKYPKLTELYRALFGLSPIGENLHHSAVDTWVCLRCFLKLYCCVSIPDAEFAETMRWLVSPEQNKNSNRVCPHPFMVSNRTRQRFPI
jgi:DNA polymerase III epsilon subunit-like protein